MDILRLTRLDHIRVEMQRELGKKPTRVEMMDACVELAGAYEHRSELRDILRGEDRLDHFGPPITPLVVEHEIDIPEGILFYPCCDRDVRDPIAYFYPNISEFHFCDTNIKNTRKALTALQYKGQASGLDITIEDQPYENQQNIYHVLVRDAKKFSKTITVVLHPGDARDVIMELGGIAVFFYRGESGNGSGGRASEGGSDINFWGRPYIETLLSRMMDEGIIMTDGSNRGHGLPEIEAMLAERVGTKELTLNGRRWSFTFRGNEGERYGPVGIWQLSKARPTTNRPFSPTFPEEENEDL